VQSAFYFKLWFIYNYSERWPLHLQLKDIPHPMMIYLLVFAAVTFGVSVFIKFGNQKKVGPLKGGDLVLLKPTYAKDYPNLPKDYPMHIEKLEDEYAVVVYMHSNNREMCHTKVSKAALKKVS
jgi:hypothetical protein